MFRLFLKLILDSDSFVQPKHVVFFFFNKKMNLCAACLPGLTKQSLSGFSNFNFFKLCCPSDDLIPIRPCHSQGEPQRPHQPLPVLSFSQYRCLCLFCKPFI